MTRRIVNELLEDALRELADEAFQRELWLSSSGPLVSSFTECYCLLLDDSGLSRALDGPDVVYTPTIDDDLRRLRALLRRIDQHRAPEAILEDPLLHQARSMASLLCRDARRLAVQGARQVDPSSPPGTRE